MYADGIDRRRHPRVPVRVPVRISTIDPETDPWTGRPFFRASREWCGNVSRGGVYVRTNEPYAPGRRVLLEIRLPSGEAVEATGKVKWSTRVVGARREETEQEVGVGIEFLGGDPRQLDSLDRWLRAVPARSRGGAAR